MPAVVGTGKFVSALPENLYLVCMGCSHSKIINLFYPRRWLGSIPRPAVNL